MDNDRKNQLTELEFRLGIRFSNTDLLHKAFLHSSYVNEYSVGESNEKLELLGDSVLALIVNEYLFMNYKKSTEGELSKIKSVVVSEHSLAMIAKEMSLGEYLSLGKGETLSGGMERPSVLADTFEALLGSYFLDRGLAEVREFILPYLIKEINKVRKNEHKQDYKTDLQHITQQYYKLCPTYNTVSEEGPDHKKTFQVEVVINDKIIGSGSGNNKKSAQQSAAKDAISRIK